MCFKKWLVSNFKNEHGPIGDLARDVKDDKDFPARAKRRQTIEEYLESCGACYGCMNAFDKAWSLYAE